MNDYIELQEYFQMQLKRAGEEIPLEDFIVFLEDNDWFHLETKIDREKEQVFFSQEDIATIQERVVLYIENHNKSFDEKLELLKKMISDFLPETQVLLTGYFTENEVSENLQYQILEFMFISVIKELYLYTDKEMAELFQRLCDDMTLTVSQHFSKFLDYMKMQRLTCYRSTYVPTSRAEGQRTAYAYDSDTYLRLVYNLFCEEVIEEDELYQKIAQSSHAANALLYLSLHMICALRDTDLINLPHPKLIEEPQEILKKISDGTLSDKTALTAVNFVLYHLKVFMPTPHKTQRYSNVSGIKLFIPESVMKHFGILFCASEAHYQLGNINKDTYIYPVKDYYSIFRYLGENIGDIFWERDFSSISSNKTFMQIIESFGDNLIDSEGEKQGLAKGYMLAALARSHKGSYGEFASTTAIYLKDAKFSGYSVEFIAKELFERGVCSFIPSMLLKILLGEAYTSLPISKQTEAITELGISPFETENMIIAVNESIKNATEIVTSLYKNTSDNRISRLSSILQNIACGNAASKSYSCMCLLSAMDKICTYPNRQQCIGCKYEISTKSTTFVLINEFVRLKKLKEQAHLQMLEDKYTVLMKQTVLPTLAEIFACITEEYGAEYVRELEDIVKEVIA